MKFFRFAPSLLFALIFCFPVLLRAQEQSQSQRTKAQIEQEKKEPVQMVVESPLALTQKPLAIQVRYARWFPVAVTLTNSGEGVQGTLSLRVKNATDTSRTPTQFFTQVDLPTNARKRIWLYGRVEATDANQFDVTFSGRGFKTKLADGVLQAAEERTRVVVTISDSDEKLSYLAGLRGPGLVLPAEATRSPDEPNFSGVVPPNPNLNANSNAAPLRPLGATHELIPSRWIGFDTADLVVLQDFPHTALTPNQIAALRSYVASGGSLLIFGGANWQRLSSSPLADLWPVVPAASGTASSNDVSTLVNRFARFPQPDPGDALGGAPVVAARGALKSGCRVLLGDARAPLLAVNDFGAGQVLFLAIDPTQPPFIGWRGLPRLWADLFHPTQRPTQIASIGQAPYDEDNYYSGGVAPVYAPEQNASGSLLEALATSPQMRTPPVSFIAWFLALYVFFLVPVNYVVLRVFDRRELAWLTIPVIVIVFSLMSYAAALRIKGTAILTRQVNLVQGSASVNGTPSSWARADAMLWLFSPRKTTYDISSADPQMVVADYISDQSTPVAIRQPEENQAFALDAAPINMWDYRSFIGHASTNLKGGVRLVTKGQSVGIQNDTPHELKGVALVSRGRVWAYKSIPAGRTGLPDAKFKDASNASTQLAGRVENASRFDPKLYPIFTGKTDPKAVSSPTGFATIPSKLLNMTLSQRWSTPDTFIIAWSDKPVAGLTIGREDARAQSLSLIMLRVENDAALRPILARGTQSTPDESRVRLIGNEAVTSARGGVPQGGIFVYEAELSNPNARSLKLDLQVDLRNQYGAPASAQKGETTPVRVEVFNFARGVWQPLRLRDTNPPKVVKNPSNNIPAGAPGGPAAPRTNWKLESTLSGSPLQLLIQQPDARAQFRVITSNDNAHITRIQVSAR